MALKFLRAIGFLCPFDELISCLFLFFCRDSKSKKIGKILGINVDLVLDLSTQISVCSDLQLRHFPTYAPQLQRIQRKMNDWRPQSFQQLAERPYKDPITFYTFWAALALGIITVMSLIVSIVQAYASINAMQLQAQIINAR
jgi:hypothetical protein